VAAAASSSSPSSLPDLLLRPLGDNHELQHIFHADIEARMLLHAAALRKGEDTPADAAAWLASRPAADDDDDAAASPGRGLRRLTPWLLPAVAVLMLVAALLLEAYEYLPRFAFSGATSSPALLMAAGERQVYRIPAHRADNPLLGGLASQLAAAEADWRAHPDDAVSYYRYVAYLAGLRKPLPPDYTATWQRLDPDNAFWPFFQAAYILTGSLHGAAGTNDVPGLLHTAAGLPAYRSYAADQQRYLLSHLRKPETFQQIGTFGSAIRIDVGRIPEKPAGLFPDSLLQAELSKGPTGAEDYHKLRDRFAGLPRWTSVIATLQPEANPLLKQADFTCQARLYVEAAAVAFLLASLLLALRLFPAHSSAARLARCVRQLLRPQDMGPLWLWGLLLPAAALTSAALLTYPWIFRWNTSKFVAVIPLALVPPVLTLMVAAAGWKLPRRTAFLGLRSGRYHRLASGLAIAVAFAPLVAGWVLLVSPDDERNGLSADSIAALLAMARVCYGVVVLWLSVQFFSGYASPSANVRHRLLAARLLPVMLLASVFMSAAALSLHGLERHLVKEAVSPVSGLWWE
jgi:hypothetical protein